MTFHLDRRAARRRRAPPRLAAEPVCPACALPIDQYDHAVHLRRAAYHAACVLYHDRRAERARWTQRT